MTADLDQVGCLELQSDLHEHVGDVGGGLIGDGVFGHCRPLYSSTSSFMRKLLPSLTSAILDRVMHHVDTVVIEGKSFRMKDEVEL